VLFSVRIWDIRPFAPQERCVKIMQGHQHTFEKYLYKNALGIKYLLLYNKRVIA
jgi:hypothetical protein